MLLGFQGKQANSSFLYNFCSIFYTQLSIVASSSFTDQPKLDNVLLLRQLVDGLIYQFTVTDRLVENACFEEKKIGMSYFLNYNLSNQKY